MSLQPKTKLTPKEYLAIERQAEHKSEYDEGEMFAMTGASRKHNLISINVAATLHAQLGGRPCEVYGSDMRIKVSPTGLYTYPDVVVVCGTPQFDDEVQDTLLNPTVIVEVLSKSPEGYDRGEKFEQYRTLDSLSDYVLVAQDKCHVEHFVRQPDDRWLLSETNRLEDNIHLTSINSDLALADVYAKVEIGE